MRRRFRLQWGRPTKNAARPRTTAAAALLTLALALSLSGGITSGCVDGDAGGGALSTLTTAANRTTSSRPATPPSTLDRAAVHERIMREQGRLGGTGTTVQATAPPWDAGRPGGPLPPGDPSQPGGPWQQAGGATTTAPPASGEGTAVVLTEGQTPLTGVWSGTAERLAAFLSAESPSPAFTVPVATLAGYYVRYAAEAGLRADLLWAQMLHETGYGRYGGSVRGEQNNYAGIGATGGGEPGISFVTAEAGVMAHVAHMVAYVYVSSPVPWANNVTDPRFDFVNPRGVAAVLADLNGRWAVPGTTYGQRIEEIARSINTG